MAASQPTPIDGCRIAKALLAFHLGLHCMVYLLDDLALELPALHELLGGLHVGIREPRTDRLDLRDAVFETRLPSRRVNNSFFSF